MLIAIRHGKTNMNTSDGERTRAWLPVPLTLEGMAAMADTATQLEELDGEVDNLYCSDLVRAVQSAEEIARVLSIEIQPKEELRDWNLGKYAGGKVTDLLDILSDYIDNPKKVVPEGEAYQTFLDRAIPFLDELVKSKDMNIAVTHNRVVTLIAALAKNKGKHPDTATLKKKGPIPPAGIMIISPDWSISFMSAKE